MLNKVSLPKIFSISEIPIRSVLDTMVFSILKLEVSNSKDSVFVNNFFSTSWGLAVLSEENLFSFALKLHYNALFKNYRDGPNVITLPLPFLKKSNSKFRRK